MNWTAVGRVAESRGRGVAGSVATRMSQRSESVDRSFLFMSTEVHRQPPTAYRQSVGRVRQAFTLLELLVATGVFIIGFTAAYGLFLSGMRYRHLAETTTRGALAASSLIHELRLDSGNTSHPGQPAEPLDYLGNGDPNDGPETVSANGITDYEDELFPYPPMPGCWFRVLGCFDLSGRDDNDKTTTLHLTLLVVPFPTAATSLSFEDLRRRMRFDSTLPTDKFIDHLAARSLAMRQDLVVLRQPNWR